MQWTFPIGATQLAQLCAALGGLVVVAYILKMRRRRHEVPFSKLWQRVLKEKESSSLWRRLRRLLSLLVQLAFLTLIIGAALDPRLGEAAASGKNVVVIIDTSASMKALDDGPKAPARIARAKEEAARILGGLGGGDAAMVVRMDGQTTALTRFESDVPHLLRVIDQVQPTDTPADLHRALQAAADALRGRKDPMIVIIGDGAYPADALDLVAWEPSQRQMGKVDLTGIDVRFVPIGKEARNVGIVAFNVRRYVSNKLSYEVLVELENFGSETESVRLTLQSGDEAIDVKQVIVPAGKRVRSIYPDLGGGDERALKAHIEPLSGIPDAFPLDDDAWALLPERKKQKVLLVTAGNLYLEATMLLDPNIVYETAKPAAWTPARSGGFDVTVFDGVTPDPACPTAAMYFHPQGDKSPIAAKGELARPFITELNPDHPVTRWVTLADVNIDKANVLVPQEGDQVLARSIRDPLIVAGKRAGKKFVAFGFGLDGTDLMLRVAFPVLLVNTLDWFAGDDAELMATYKTGKVWSIPVDAEEKLREVSIIGPHGTVTAPVQGGRAHYYGQHVGVYRVLTPEAELQVAANLADPGESNIKPSPKLTLAGKELTPPPTLKPSVSKHLWQKLVLAALLLSALEWLTYNRRYTV